MVISLRCVVALVLVAGALAMPPGAATSSTSSAVLKQVAKPVANPVAGTACAAFPDDNWWHADVSDLPEHRRSAQWLSHMSTDVDLHPDFGPNDGAGPDYGIPVTVVGKAHRKVKVRFRYASESDRVRYPLGSDTRVEGGRSSSGDRHAVVVVRGSCKLYETFATRKTARGWKAGSGAVWSLGSNALRPDGWTSADAAGLPILPGLLRRREVRRDRIDHAIRFTTDVTARRHLWPARHDAGSKSSLAYPPMGARFRLDGSWRPRGFSVEAKRVVHAMQTYGLVLADNGSPWFFQGEQHHGWPDDLIADLKQIPASAFVAVDTSSLQVSASSGQVR